MTTSTISVDTAVNNLLRMIQSQLGNVQSLVDTQAVMISESLNTESDQYNRLIDQLDQSEKDFLALQLKHHSFVDCSDKKEQELTEQIAQLNAKLSRHALALNDSKELANELKELRALNPKRLKSKNAELSKKYRETSDLLLKLKKQFRDNERELLKQRSNTAQLTAATTELTLDNERLRAKLLRHDGNVIQKEYHGKDGLTCFIYPPRSELWPNDINDALIDVIRERCLSTHSHLIDRVEWAQSEDLADVAGLSEKHLKLLNESSFYSVYAVCHVPPTQLHRMVKGVGQETAKQIHAVCTQHVNKWEAQGVAA
ncbi:hypothetical protein ACN08N_23735 [Photobacterium leiognathi subsp. mandapamensis]|uniref:hypothetical protein n=1 Tax=Photobacterium leiognathi TaxID=553611 RepID=UPI003AF3C02A